MEYHPCTPLIILHQTNASVSHSMPIGVSGRTSRP
uniref:Uncharacterized protein n=1 Tax=Arundo donax TaxID=35708 RepID=A0A0A9D318_ARUDO